MPDRQQPLLQTRFDIFFNTYAYLDPTAQAVPDPVPVETHDSVFIVANQTGLAKLETHFSAIPFLRLLYIPTLVHRSSQPLFRSLSSLTALTTLKLALELKNGDFVTHFAPEPWQPLSSVRTVMFTLVRATHRQLRTIPMDRIFPAMHTFEVRDLTRTCDCEQDDYSMTAYFVDAPTVERSCRVDDHKTRWRENMLQWLRQLKECPSLRQITARHLAHEGEIHRWTVEEL